MPAQHPLLIIVTGPPASGKTTIATEISSVVSTPAFSKDEFKELLADSIPGSGLEWSSQLGGAAFEMLYAVMRTMVRSGMSCLVEANFHPSLSLAPFQEVASEARIIQVVCTGDPEILMQRYLARHSDGARHPVHLDTDPDRRTELAEAFRRDHELPLAGHLLHYDTTLDPPVALDEVVARINAATRY